MKIKSITDVITNSSSETFIISYPKKEAKEIEELLKKWKAAEDVWGSGEGGIIEVVPLEEWAKEGSYSGESPREVCYKSRIPWIPESLVVTIDHNFLGVIENFRYNFPEAYSTDWTTYYPIYDYGKDGKETIRLTSNYEEWKSLGDPLRMHGEWALSEMDWWNYEDKD